MKKSIDTKKSFDLEGINEISLSVSSQDINIIPVDREDLEVHLYGDVTCKSEGDIPKLVWETNKDNISVKVETEKSGFFNILSLGITRINLNLDVFIPRDYSKHLNTKSSSGDTNIKNLNLDCLLSKVSSGNLNIESVKATVGKVKSSSGNITLEKLEGNFKAVASSGRVSGNDCEGYLNISTSSGKIKVDNLKGDLDTTSSSGSTYISYLDFNNTNANMKTSSGSVHLTLPSDSSFNITTQTSSGSFKMDFPLTMNEINSRKNLEGQFGDSPTSNISIKTSSGSISIKKS